MAGSKVMTDFHNFLYLFYFFVAFCKYILFGNLNYKKYNDMQRKRISPICIGYFMPSDCS